MFSLTGWSADLLISTLLYSRMGRRLIQKKYNKLKNFRKIQSLLHPWHKFPFLHIISMRVSRRRPETRNILMLTENSFLLGRLDVSLRGHPDDEGQQDGQQGGAGGHSSEVEEQTRSQHRRRLGNTPTQQQLPHCLTELRKRRRGERM